MPITAQQQALLNAKAEALRIEMAASQVRGTYTAEEHRATLAYSKALEQVRG